MNRQSPRYIVSAAALAALGFGLGAVTGQGRTLQRWKRVRTSAMPAAEQQKLQADAERGRAERAARLRQIGLNKASLANLLARYKGLDRETLIREGYLHKTAPAKGTALIGATDRTAAGSALLEQAKDVLYGLLFGDKHTRTDFHRVERELLTVTVPRKKADALEFMQASTELNAAGTWQDPDSVSNDERADNLVIEVEYGEIKEEWIGDGIVATLRLINHLEVNEQILYARMANIEQSTLVD
jgi:hypothetical protein